MGFDEAFSHVVGLEGGYVNDPRDPGGETKYGITKRDHPSVDIKGLTVEDAKEIYRVQYWAPACCDAMPWPLNALVFDSAVNQGVETAKKLLQKSLGVTQDGVIGKATLSAIAKSKQGELCALFLADRALRYIGTRNFDVFGRGWLRRLFQLSMEV